MTRAIVAPAPKRRFPRLVVTSTFILVVVAAILMRAAYATTTAPLPTPGPTQTARVDTVIKTVEVTAVPTRTSTIEPYWLTRTAMPTVTYAPRVPTRTPTPIWISDPASGRMSER